MITIYMHRYHDHDQIAKFKIRMHVHLLFYFSYCPQYYNSSRDKDTYLRGNYLLHRPRIQPQLLARYHIYRLWVTVRRLLPTCPPTYLCKYLITHHTYAQVSIDPPTLLRSDQRLPIKSIQQWTVSSWPRTMGYYNARLQDLRSRSASSVIQSALRKNYIATHSLSASGS